MPMITVYTLGNCDTCRRATKWLRDNAVAFTEKAIRETPPPLSELRHALAATGGERRKLLNTSGRDYRELRIAEKVPALSDAEFLRLLAGNGNLIKRPFLSGSGLALTGFNEAAWQAALFSTRAL
jgi:arsenate reductase (glutaredoxin)